jgi:hypothetical protein
MVLLDWLPPAAIDQRPRKHPCSHPGIRPEFRFPHAAAQTRIVSVARIRLDSRKSARSFWCCGSCRGPNGNGGCRRCPHYGKRRRDSLGSARVLWARRLPSGPHVHAAVVSRACRLARWIAWSPGVGARHVADCIDRICYCPVPDPARGAQRIEQPLIQIAALPKRAEKAVRVGEGPDRLLSVADFRADGAGVLEEPKRHRVAPGMIADPVALFVCTSSQFASFGRA